MKLSQKQKRELEVSISGLETVLQWIQSDKIEVCMVDRSPYGTSYVNKDGQGLTPMNKKCGSFNDWMLDQFDAVQLQDIANDGADGGWNGLTYYDDTQELYARHKGDIWATLLDDAESMGHDNVFQLIATFGGADVESNIQFENLLVWYMAERFAHRYTENADEYKQTPQARPPAGLCGQIH